MKYVTATALALLFGLSACTSSDDNPTTSPQPTDPNNPVTGEFHIIKPADVDAYVANFEAQKARTAFTFDGTAHSLTFVEEDSDNKALVASYDDKLVVIGFDLGNEEPLPTIALVQGEGENITNQWVGRELNIETTAEDDFVYSGRLTHSVSGEEFDVTLVFNEALITGGTSTLTVSGTDALLNGDMGTGTYIQMRDMIKVNPTVNRVVIQQSSGSVNDAINVHTGRLIRAASLATHVPADGNINSGAVDLFVAGVTRTVEPGGKLGVHSWCCEDGVTADKLPRNSPAHGTQLTYFREMLPTTGVDFYFFTLQAAPFTTVHVMTREELTQYAVVSNSPMTSETGDSSTAGGDSEVLARFPVIGEELDTSGVSADLADRANVFWRRFTDLIPSDSRHRITQFELLRDSVNGAHASTINDDTTKWVIGIGYTRNSPRIEHALIHEFAHVLTLNETQVDYSSLEETCATYSINGGCAFEGSTIGRFVQQFWPQSLQDELDNSFGLGPADKSPHYQFYLKYKDRFVTEYAASHPSEDLAEVFTEFVKRDRPTGSTIADQKLRMLWNDPNMEALRESIRPGLNPNQEKNVILNQFSTL